eukprot:jgi/Orpsp1_1/1190107/evm.model.d7180000076628.1
MIVDWFIFLIVCYVIIDFFCVNTTIEEDDSEGRLRNLTAVVVIPNGGAAEDKPDDCLPPYTPPTPKTQAAFADLPPSYDETWDITETNINANNLNGLNYNNVIDNNNDIDNNNNNDNNTNNNNNSNVNTNNNNNSNVNADNVNISNLPSTINVNINPIPEIVINPINQANTQAQPVA